MYRSLDLDKTLATVAALCSRIEERFPGSGLSKVCGELHAAAKESREKVLWIARPNYSLRVLLGVIIVALLAGLVASVTLMDISLRTMDLAEFIQVTEAGMNDIVLIGAAVFFIVTMELRIKRARALEALHELRAIAHVIDMHQLTKDPSDYGPKAILTTDKIEPQPALDVQQLIRYLDYCSEMLSLTGKIAAIYAQHLNDAIVLAAVNEIEALTTGLSRKIWQKIMILNRLGEA